MADISVSLTLDDGQFNRALDQATDKAKKLANTTKKGFDDLSKEAKKSSEVISSAFAKIGAAIAGISFGAIVKDAANVSSEIVNTARALDTSVASVKGWSDALVAAGGDADNTRDALIDLTQKLSESINNGGDVLEAFNAIGLSLTDLQKISNEDLMKEVIQGLADVEDGASRSRLAMVLMGEDVKKVDFTKAAQGYDKFVKSAEKSVPALVKAQQAQQQFNQTYQQFQDQVTQVIPWDDLSSGLKAIGDNLDTIAQLIKAFGELSVAYLLLTKAVPALTAAQAVLYGSITMTAGGMGILGTAIAGVTGFFDLMIANFAIAGMAFKSMVVGTNAAVGGLAAFRLGINALFLALSRLTIIGVVVYAINDLVKAFTGFDAIDRATQDLKEFFDMVNLFNGSDFKELVAIIKSFGGGVDPAATAAIDKFYGRTRDAANDVTDAQKAATEEVKKTNEEHARTSKLLTETGKAISQMTDEYARTNQEQLRQIQSQINMVGIGEDQKILKQALVDLEGEHISKIDELNQKIKATKIPEEQALYKKGIEDVNKAYTEQVTQVTNLTEQLIARNQQERQSLFNTQQRIESTQRIRDLEHERASIFLPLIEQKYRDIEKAADDAITSQIEAEAKARGLKAPSDLPQSDVAAITKSVRQQVDYEKELTKSAYDTANAFQLKIFKQNIINDNARELKDIYDDMGSSTLREIDRLEFNIMKSAQDRATAEIQAEEARRGSKLSAEEAQAYYDASIQGTKELIEATKKSYDMSRSWATGWTIAMNNYIEEAGNAAQHAQNIFATAMSGMEDLLINFVKTGKFEWKNFLAMMLEELLRAQIQVIFANMISDMSSSMRKNTSMGSSNRLLGYGGSTSGLFDGLNGSSSMWDIFKNVGGGIWDGLSSIGGGIADFFGGFFADGGHLQSGKWGIVGENGPEIIQGPANITPLERINTNSSGQAVNVTYNINAVDSMSFKQMLAKDPSFIYGLTLQGAKGIPVRR